MKKLISLIGAGALLLSVVAPVLAGSDHCDRCGGRRDRCCPVVQNENDVDVHANVDVDANTGNNRIEVERARVSDRGDLEIESGDAEAWGDVVVDNTNRVRAGSRSGPVVSENDVDVRAEVDVDANTGNNNIKVKRACVGGDLEIETGDAYADGHVEVTNANYVRVR